MIARFVGSAGLAVTLCVGLLVVANAQTSGAPGAGSQTAAASPATAAGGGSAPSGGTAPVAVGWYYARGVNCYFWTDSSGASLWVFDPVYGYYYTYSSPYMNMIAPACQTGNWMAFYIDNVGFAGHWSYVYTYTFK